MLLPSHKSHVDYLILSYIFNEQNLPLPLIALAGVVHPDSMDALMGEDPGKAVEALRATAARAQTAGTT